MDVREGRSIQNAPANLLSTGDHFSSIICRCHDWWFIHSCLRSSSVKIKSSFKTFFCWQQETNLFTWRKFLLQSLFLTVLTEGQRVTYVTFPLNPVFYSVTCIRGVAQSNPMCLTVQIQIHFSKWIKNQIQFWIWIVNHNPIHQIGFQSGLNNLAIQSSNTRCIWVVN